MLYSLIEIYLKNNPKEKRPQEELDQLNNINKFKEDRVILNAIKATTNAIKITADTVKNANNVESSSDSEESSSDEKLIIPPKPAPAKRNKLAAVRPICKQCTKASNGFKCLPGQVHIQCSLCNNYMPDRNNEQRCAICLKIFCNIYWKALKCRFGLNKVDDYITSTFQVIRASALNENKHEQTILYNYINRKKLNMNMIARYIIDEMEINH